MTTDMTVGRPLPIITKFFIPLFLGNLFQQFYNMVDAMIVGKFLGVNALAGVGATSSINFLILGFTMGITGGFGIMFSQRFGAGDYESLRKCIANSLYLTVLVSVVFTPVTVIFCRRILTALRTPEDIMEEAYSYIVVIFGGIIVTMLYNSAAAILRSIGDSRTPLVVLIAASFINILLDICFITVFGMGTNGASIATVISQALAGAGCLAYTFRHYEILKLKREHWEIDGDIIVRLLKIGVPMGIQYSVTAIGGVSVQFAINTLGSVCVAAYTAGSRLRIMFTCGMDMIGMAVSTFCGQNIGAGKKERVTQGVCSGLALVACFSVVCIICIYSGGKAMCAWFVDPSNTEVIDRMVYYLRLTISFCPFLGLIFVLRNTLQGMGYSLAAMFAGLFELVARCAVAFGVLGKVTYAVICYADPFAWIMADVLLVSCFVYVCRHAKIPGVWSQIRKGPVRG